MVTVRDFTVQMDNAGQRLDKFLSDNMPEFSRSEIQHFIVTNSIGNVAKFGTKVKMGEIYRVSIPDVQTTCAMENISDDLDLDILYEDNDIIVINKPRGIVMYPSAGNLTGTFVQNILSYTHLSCLGGNTRPGVVHRLDKDTSGVMVFAKTDIAYKGLVKIFSEHDLTRKYIAFVWGVPNWTGADITGNIARSSRNRQKMSMVKTGGKPAHTVVDVVNVWSKFNISEFRCTLLTGRTHQIRVHLSAHGFPVLCDGVYGKSGGKLGSVRNVELLDFLKNHNGQMLHAEYLSFKHPVSGAQMEFKTKIPDDMLELREILNS